MVHRHHDATAVGASSGTGRYTSLLPTPLDLMDVGSRTSPAARPSVLVDDVGLDTPPASLSQSGSSHAARKGQLRTSLTATPEGSYERPTSRSHRAGATHRPRLLVLANDDGTTAAVAPSLPTTTHATTPSSANHSCHRRGGGGGGVTTDGGGSLGILEIFARARVLPAADGVAAASGSVLVDGGTPAPPGATAARCQHHPHALGSDRRERHRLAAAAPPPSSFGRAAVAEMTRRAPVASKALSRDTQAREADHPGSRLDATLAPMSLDDASASGASARRATARHTIQEFQAYTTMSAIGPLLADACRCIIRESEQRCSSAPLDIVTECGCRVHEQQQQRSVSGSISPTSRSRTSALASTSSFDLVSHKQPTLGCGSPGKATSSIASSSARMLHFTQRHHSDEADAQEIQMLLNELCTMVKFGGSGPLVVVASLIYLNRIASTCKCDRYQITSHNWCRLVTVCLLVATKMFIEEEHGRVNRKFAAAANIDLGELRRLEIHMLYLIDFTLVIQEDEVAQWCDWIHVVATRRGMRTPLQNFLFDNPPPSPAAAAVNGGGASGQQPMEAQLSVVRSPAARPLPAAPEALPSVAVDAAPRLFSSVDNTEDGPWAEEENEAVSAPPLPPSPPPLLDDSPLKHFQLAAAHGTSAAKRDDDDLQDFFRMARTATLSGDVAPSGPNPHNRSSTRRPLTTQRPGEIAPQQHPLSVAGLAPPRREELGGAARFLRGASFGAEEAAVDDDDDSPWSRAKSQMPMRLSPLSR